MANKLSKIVRDCDTAGPAPMTKSVKEEQARWRAEDDLRTLSRAAEISKDRGRLSMAKKVAKEQIKDLSRVAGMSKSAKPSGRRFS